MANVQVFNKVEFLEGLNVNVANRKSLEVLVQNEEDAKRYLELVEVEEKKWGKESAKSLAVMSLREEQIDKSKMTYEEFEASYTLNPVQALQSLFWHEITQDDVFKLMQKWLTNHTLEDLFNKHEKSPYDNFFSFTL